MNYEKMTLVELKKSLKKEFPIVLDEDIKKQVLSSIGENVELTLLSFKDHFALKGITKENTADSICVPCNKCKNISIMSRDLAYSDINCENCNNEISLGFENHKETINVHLYHKDRGIYSIHSLFGECIVDNEGKINYSQLSISDAFAIWYLDERGFFYNIKGLNQVKTEKSMGNNIKGFDSKNLNIVLGYEDIPNKTINLINSLLEVTNEKMAEPGSFIEDVKTAVKNINKLRMIEKEKEHQKKRDDLINKLKDNLKSDKELFEITKLKNVENNLINTIHTKIGTNIGVYVYCPKCEVVNNISLGSGDTKFMLECCNTMYNRQDLGERDLNFHRYGVDSIINVQGTYYRVNNCINAHIDNSGELFIRNRINSIEELKKYPKLSNLDNASNKLFKTECLYSDKANTSKSSTIITKDDLFEIFNFFNVKNKEKVYNLIYKEHEREIWGSENIVFNKSSIYNIRLNKILAYYPKIVETIGLNILSELNNSELSLLIGYPDKDMDDFESITGITKETFEYIYNSDLRAILALILEINNVKALTTEDLKTMSENMDILIPLNRSSYGLHSDFFDILNILIDADQYNLKRLLNRIRYYAENENLSDNNSYHHYLSYLNNLIINIRDGVVDVDDNIYYPQNLKLNMYKQKHLRNISYDVGLESRIYSHKKISYKEDNIVIKSILNMRHLMNIEKSFGKPLGFLMLDNDYRNLMYVSKNDEVIAVLVGSCSRYSYFNLLRIIPKNNLTKKERKIINNFEKKYKGDINEY